MNNKDLNVPVLKKQKNAFDTLREGQERLQIVLPKKSKTSISLHSSSTPQKSKKRKFENISPLLSQQSSLGSSLNLPQGDLSRSKIPNESLKLSKVRPVDDKSPKPSKTCPIGDYDSPLLTKARPRDDDDDDDGSPQLTKARPCDDGDSPLLTKARPRDDDGSPQLTKARPRDDESPSLSKSRPVFQESETLSQRLEKPLVAQDTCEIQEIQYFKIENEEDLSSPPTKKKVIFVKKKLVIHENQPGFANSQNSSEKEQKEWNGAYKIYSTEFKEEYIEAYLDLGLTKACLRKGVTIDLASKWVKKWKEEGLLGLVDKRGHNSGPYNKYLDLYILEEFRKRRVKGIMVNGMLLKAIALQAPSAYKPEGFSASNGWLARFLARNQIVKRKKTLQIQTIIEKLNHEMKTYLEVLQTLKDSGEDLVYVNFDEVSVAFDLAADYTYELKGKKDIKSLCHLNTKTRATVTLGVASNGDVLPPLLTFIYKYSGKKTRSFPKKHEKFKNRFSPYMVRFTESGFNNDEIIIEYIDKIILNWKSNISQEVVLVMDQARCHISEKVLKHLDKLKLTYILIPAGGTYLFQPLDIALNRPFKEHLRQFYLSWLESETSVSNVKLLTCPEIEKIIDWTYQSVSNFASLKVIESFSLAGIVGNHQDLFGGSKLNAKLQILVEAYAQNEQENEAEYMDEREIQLQNLALGQEYCLESSQ